MKTGFTRLAVLAFALTGSLGLFTFDVRADLEVSSSVQINAATDFYEPLAPSGVWVDVGDYGRCWHPNGVDAGWRPYCDGTWVWTDCGWYWQSDEPWAWACYHYGSWVDDPHYGWVWVPGVEWAPAWVYWRTGGGYIGWAPCSPRGVVVVSGAFVFVDEHHFHERHNPSTVIVNNATIINNTRQFTGDRRENRDLGGRQQTVVINNGPDVNSVAKATGRTFAPVSVQEEDRHTVVPTSVRHRQSKSPNGANAPVAAAPAVQEQTRPVPQQPNNFNSPVPPGEMPAHPGKPLPPERNLPPSKQEIVPPSQPPPHESPATIQPNGTPPKHKVPPPQQSPKPNTPPQPNTQPQPNTPAPQPEAPPSGSEEKGDHGAGHDKDKDNGHD